MRLMDDMDLLPAMRGLTSHPNLTSVHLYFETFYTYDTQGNQEVRSLFEALPSALETLTMRCMDGSCFKPERVDKSYAVCTQLLSCARDTLTTMRFDAFLCLEFFIGHVPATVQHIEFLYMSESVSQAHVQAFLARHTHLRSLTFTKCTMAEDVCLKRLRNQNPGCVITVVPPM